MNKDHKVNNTDIDETMKYNRILHNDFILLLKGTLKEILTYKPDGDCQYFIYDIQLRRKNTLTVYCGTGSVLNCTYLPRKKVLVANAKYANKLGITSLEQEWDCTNNSAMMELCQVIKYYLNSAHKFIPPNNFSNEEEGYWQNKICVDFGRYWEHDDEWLIVDREVIPEFLGGKTAKEYILEQITKPYNTITSLLRSKNPEKWCKKESFGDELDILAIDKMGRLVCIELKHGHNASGIYWGIYQACVYRELASRGVNIYISGAVEIIRQKILLGLIPKEAEDRLQLLEHNRGEVYATLAVARPNIRSSCWDNLIESSQMIQGAEIPIAFIDCQDTSVKKCKIYSSTILPSELKNYLGNESRL